MTKLKYRLQNVLSAMEQAQQSIDEAKYMLAECYNDRYDVPKKWLDQLEERQAHLEFVVQQIREREAELTD